eukprot:11225963-Lingulodinium_polyedra.AAC.1
MSCAAAAAAAAARGRGKKKRAWEAGPPAHPPGPDGLRSLFQYPTSALAALSASSGGAAMRDRLVHNLKLGINVAEDYAGMGTMGIAMEMLCRTACSDVGRPLVRHYRASDISPLCRRVLGLDKKLIGYGMQSLCPEHIM